MIITITEVNDIPPRFTSPFQLTIPERQPPGRYLMTVVATEPNNNIIRYRLVNDTGEFNLVPETG